MLRRYLARRGLHLLLWGSGNILIAVGAILPAFGGAFSRMGFSGALYVSELLGAALMFIGFIRAITPLSSAASPPDAA